MKSLKLTIFILLIGYFSFAQETLTITKINPYDWNSVGVDAMLFRSNPNAGLPLVIFAHGLGENSVAKIYNNGLPLVLKNGFRPPYPVVVIAPIATGGWVPANWFPNLIKRAYELYKIDTTKVTITGISAGGSAVWESVLNINEPFAKKIASIVPVSAYWANANQNNISWFKTSKVSVWAVVGGSTTDQTEFSFREGNQRLVNSINAQVSNLAKMSIRGTLGHTGYDVFYNGTYKDGTVDFWSFIKDKKSGGGATVPPVIVPPVQPLLYSQAHVDSIIRSNNSFIEAKDREITTLAAAKVKLSSELAIANGTIAAIKPEYERILAILNNIILQICNK